MIFTFGNVTHTLLLCITKPSAWGVEESEARGGSSKILIGLGTWYLNCPIFTHFNVTMSKLKMMYFNMIVERLDARTDYEIIFRDYLLLEERLTEL